MNLNDDLWYDIEKDINNNANKRIYLSILGDNESIIAANKIQLLCDNEGHYSAILIRNSNKLDNTTFKNDLIYDLASITNIDITTVEEL